MLMRPNKPELAETAVYALSMAVIARVIWLCAGERYWPDRGLVSECVTCFYCLFFFFNEICSDISRFIFNCHWSLTSKKTRRKFYWLSDDKYNTNRETRIICAHYITLQRFWQATAVLLVPFWGYKAVLVPLRMFSLQRSTSRTCLVPFRVWSRKYITGDDVLCNNWYL